MSDTPWAELLSNGTPSLFSTLPGESHFRRAESPVGARVVRSGWVGLYGRPPDGQVCPLLGCARGGPLWRSAWETGMPARSFPMLNVDPTSFPLQGKRILVTRASEQAGALSDRLRQLGAIPVEFPTIQITPPEDWAPLDGALKRLCARSPLMRFKKILQYRRGVVARFIAPAVGSESYYTWLVFTSANGVNICFDRLHTLAYNTNDIGTVRVAAIGPATAQALRQHGVKPDLVPGEYIAEGVAAALIEDAYRHGESLEGKRILLLRAAEARKVLVEKLQGAGAIVEEVAAYRTRGAAIDDEQEHELLRLLQAGQLDILTFTSSSTVRHFVQWLADRTPGATVSPIVLVTQNPQLKIACIGPITSQTARELGLEVQIEASAFTIDGLVEAIVQHEESA